MTCETCGGTAGTCGTGGWTGPQPGDPDNNLTIQAVPAFGGIDVSWSYPGVNPNAVAHVLLYRSGSSVFAEAVQLAVVGGTRYSDRIDAVATYYYWIRIVSVNGTVADPVGPASATSRPLIGDFIEQLTGQIDAGLLAETLRGRLDEISILNANLAAEIFDRESGQTSFAEALADVQAGVAEAHTFIANEIASRTDEQGAIIEQINMVAATAEDQVAQALVTTQAWVDTVDNKAGALWSARLTANNLVGGFGIYNDGSTVQAGFDVDTFWVGRTGANKRKPFIIVDDETFIDQAVINELTFSKLKDEAGTFIVESGKIKTEFIDTKGMVIRDAAGTPVFSAGSGLSWSLLTGLPAFAPSNADRTADNIAYGISGQGALATANYAQIGSTVRFPGGSVMNTTDFVNTLSKINSSTISSFMDSAAVGNAYIGNLAVTTAKIGYLEVTNSNIQGGACSAVATAESGGTSVSIGITVPAGAVALEISVANQMVLTGYDSESTNPTWAPGETYLNGFPIGPGNKMFIWPGEGYYTINATRSTPVTEYSVPPIQLLVKVFKK